MNIQAPGPSRVEFNFATSFAQVRPRSLAEAMDARALVRREIGGPHAQSCYFAHYLRGVIPAAIPAFVIHDGDGSGLARMSEVERVIFGTDRPSLDLPSDAKLQRKLATMARQGLRSVTFITGSGDIECSTLCHMQEFGEVTLLTARGFEPVGDMPIIKIVLSGRPTTETFPRRVVMIDDAVPVRPNAMGPEIRAAFETMVGYWTSQGRPEAADPWGYDLSSRMDKFSRAIGGLLECCGETEFRNAGNIQATRALLKR